MFCSPAPVGFDLYVFFNLTGINCQALREDVINFYGSKDVARYSTGHCLKFFKGERPEWEALTVLPALLVTLRVWR